MVTCVVNTFPLFPRHAKGKMITLIRVSQLAFFSPDHHTIHLSCTQLFPGASSTIPVLLPSMGYILKTDYLAQILRRSLDVNPRAYCMVSHSIVLNPQAGCMYVQICSMIFFSVA
jgi:hypothetical protein